MMTAHRQKPSVFLINPPFNEAASVGSSRSIRHVLNVIPPLGLSYCAAVLEEAGYGCEIFDCSVERRDLWERLARVSPAVVCLTASTPVFDAACALARAVRRLLPRSLLVIGGCHVTALPAQTMETGLFDAGVIGEGERTVVELVNHLCAGGTQGLEAVAGIVFTRGKETVITPARGLIEDLDALPLPARHLLPPLTAYRPTPASYRRLPLGIVITSRGCPHQCTFCDRAVFGNRFRARGIEAVLAEVEEVCGRYGAREIRFFDDCFAFDRGRCAGICAGLRKRKRRVPWTCLTSVASVTPELLREMAGSGCWQVLYGLESGDERMLGLLRKGAGVEQNIRAVKWAKRAGLSVRADFIVGTPGETDESLARTLAFALAHPLDYAHFNKFVPYPGTRLHTELLAHGARLDLGKGSSITDHSQFVYIPETIRDREGYKAFINRAHRRFYLRWGYILRRLASLRSWEEFCGQLRGLLAIVGLR